MRKNIVAGNWKMNKTLQEGLALATELNNVLADATPNCQVIIGTPFIHLASAAAQVDTTKVHLAAQNCAEKESGAYTGEISASMVKSTGAEYVILGHSERRAYYGETYEILRNKVLVALKNDLKPIFCIGELKEERETNQQNEVVKAQLEGSVFNLTEEEFSKIVLAYEPVWAIGTGKTASPEEAQAVHAVLRAQLKAATDQSARIKILYGGSMNAANAATLLAQPDIDGGLIGGASLKAQDFLTIIAAAQV